MTPEEEPLVEELVEAASDPGLWCHCEDEDCPMNRLRKAYLALKELWESRD